MTKIGFEPSIDPSTKDVILRQLEAIEAEHGVRVLFAIESGSRAWGFPSPDSDYDVRFVYVHEADWYLSLTPGRDVIELPIDGDLDINGWDIRKALNLLLKPNPVLLEWLSSPIRYRWNPTVCDALTDFSKQVTHGAACLHHYLHLGQRQWKVYVEGKDEISLKKYFYIVRPALAIRWLRLCPEAAPPMNFQALMAGTDVPETLHARLLDLLEAKSRSKELGLAPRIPEIDGFVTEEFDWAEGTSSRMPRTQRQLDIEADDLFRKIVRGAL